MKIAVDAMGGDHAPYEVVKGAVEAAHRHGVEIVLVGRQNAIQQQLARSHLEDASLSIVNASEVVGFHEHPARAIRQKQDSSVVVGMNLLKSGTASAFVSAGNSGAIVCATLLILGKVEGIERPALGILYPTPSGPVLLLDIGANSDCRPSFLVQFAQVGSIYMGKVLGIDCPRIGLLSSGEEELRGNRLVRESHKLLKRTGLNFVGNIEGGDISKGVVDVVVTDGFTGNVVLKSSEGFSETLFSSLGQAFSSRPRFRVAGFFLKPFLQAFAKELDYTEYGGALLLGVNGNVVIAHGRSQAKAISSAVRLAREAVEQGIPEVMRGGNYGQTNRGR